MNWDGIEKRQDVNDVHIRIFEKLDQIGNRQASMATSIVGINKHLETQNGRLGRVEEQATKNDKAISILRTVALVLFGLAGLGAAVWQAIVG